MDIGSEQALIQETRCHCGAPVSVGAYAGQVIDGPFAQIHHTVGRMGPCTHPVVISPIPE